MIEATKALELVGDCICTTCRHALIRTFHNGPEGAEGPDPHIICTLMTHMGAAFAVVWQEPIKEVYVTECTHHYRSKGSPPIEAN